MERPSYLILEMLADPLYPSVIMPEPLVHTSTLGIQGAVKFFGTGPYRWVVHDDGEMVLKDLKNIRYLVGKEVVWQEKNEYFMTEWNITRCRMSRNESRA